MSELLDSWCSGAGLPDTLVIDGHVHIGEWPHGETFRNVDEAILESIAFMDASGVDACCAQSGGYMWSGTDYRMGNDFLLTVCKGLPDRMIGFTNVNPNDTRENILAELDRMYEAGIRCIKLLNSYQDNYPGDGPNLMALYAYADEHNMLVFNHSWTYDEIMKISSEFPETDFIFGHYGHDQNHVLKECKNVYANIWGYGIAGWLDYGFEEVGVGKFIAGSDAFLNPMAGGIGPVVFADIPDDDKRLVLGVTQARLWDKVGVLPGWIKDKYSL